MDERSLNSRHLSQHIFASAAISRRTQNTGHRIVSGQINGVRNDLRAIGNIAEHAIFRAATSSPVIKVITVNFYSWGRKRMMAVEENRRVAPRREACTSAFLSLRWPNCAPRIPVIIIIAGGPVTPESRLGTLYRHGRFAIRSHSRRDSVSRFVSSALRRADARAGFVRLLRPAISEMRT